MHTAKDYGRCSSDLQEFVASDFRDYTGVYGERVGILQGCIGTMLRVQGSRFEVLGHFNLLVPDFMVHLKRAKQAGFV